MENNIIGANLRRIRIANGISQGSLAKRAGISTLAVGKIENAKTQPRINTLQALAKALNIKIEKLFRPLPTLKSVRFRSTKKMQMRENIIAEVSHWLENFNFLEDVLNEKKESLLLEIRSKKSKLNPEKIAEDYRDTLDLKEDEPIHDIFGLLESKGIKVHTVKYASDKFFGLSIGKSEGGPAIIVNIWERIPVERWIFSAAHELGHLIMHLDAYDVNISKEDELEEKQANQFASYFLMPNDGFIKEWEEAKGLHLVDRVLKVKRIFRVSYKTVLYRLIDLGLADKSIWGKYNLLFKRRYGKELPFKEEPSPLDNENVPEPWGFRKFDFLGDRFSRLARHAIENDKISLSRGAEILQINIEEMKDLASEWEEIL